MKYSTTIATNMLSSMSDAEVIQALTVHDSVTEASKWANSPEWQWLDLLSWPPPSAEAGS